MSELPEPWLSKKVGLLPRLLVTGSELPKASLEYGVPPPPVLFRTYPCNNVENEFLQLAGYSEMEIALRGWHGLPDIIFYEVERRVIKELMRLGIPVSNISQIDQTDIGFDLKSISHVVMRPADCQNRGGRRVIYASGKELHKMSDSLKLKSHERDLLFKDNEYRITLVANLILTDRLRGIFGRYIPVRQPSPLNVIEASERYCATIAHDFKHDYVYAAALQWYYRQYYAPIFPVDHPIPGHTFPPPEERDYADKPINFERLIFRFEAFRRKTSVPPSN